jgi:acyl-CoA synthetase (AMP-forming)/AMP-acid ligase II
MTTDPIGLGGRMPAAELVAHYRADGYWADRLLVDHLEADSRNWSDHIAIVDRFGRTSFAELLDLSRRLAVALHEEGIGPGDVFLVQLPNWTAFSVFHLALTYLGAITVNVASNYRHHEVATIAAVTRARGIAVPESFRRFDFMAMVDDIRSELPALRTAITVGGRGRSGFRSYEGMLARPPVPAATWQRVLSPPGPDEVTLISFTSGTTGEPKGVMHTSNTLGAIHAVFAKACGLGKDDTILMSAPVGHSIGLMHGVRLPIVLGASVVLQDEWDARVAAELMRHERATFTVLAPTLLYDLVRQPDLRSDPPRELRLLLCGGSYLQESLMRDAAAAMPHTAIAPLWGMTEGIGSLCGTECPPDKLATTDGHPVPAAEITIVSDTGETLASGQEGELLLRSPTLFAGYFGRPELNREIFTEDGRFHTGDLAVLGADNFLRIRGRLKELIIRGGVNISPVEIERALLVDKRIGQVAVVGAPDERLGERICAFVVPARGARVELADLVAAAERAGLAKQKWPEQLQIVSELPTTLSGKVRRHVLATQLEAGKTKGHGLAADHG